MQFIKSLQNSDKNKTYRVIILCQYGNHTPDPETDYPIWQVSDGCCTILDCCNTCYMNYDKDKAEKRCCR
jgi:hypothetical protein